jgi:hypothetical protein
MACTVHIIFCGLTLYASNLLLEVRKKEERRKEREKREERGERRKERRILI